MNHYSRIAMIVSALVLAAIVGALAYNAGVMHGVEQSGKIVVAAPGAYPHYAWHPFGFFFPPFFFILFWILIARSFFWRRGWHRGACGADSRLEDWHRHAHERMWDNEEKGGTPRQ